MKKAALAAIVTGAASGIGRATCERFSGAGWNVLAVDLNRDALAWTDAHEAIESYVGDISSVEDNRGLLQQAEAQFGGVDAAILNAALSLNGASRILRWKSSIA